MSVRKIIEIDEEKCTGCGLCIPSCAEGALQIVNGKAKLVKDIYCDGLGACLGECPEDALHIVERDADEFDEEAAMEHVTETRGKDAKEPPEQFQCPGSRMMSIEAKDAPSECADVPSELRNWPVKIDLTAPNAPYFSGADLLIAADCAPFAFGNFHKEVLKGHAVIIGCPKLNDNEAYLNKIAAIIKQNDLKSVTVCHMEVPCCFGLNFIVDKAIELSGKDVQKKKIIVGIKGNIVDNT